MDNELSVLPNKGYEAIADANQRRFNDMITAFEKVKELAEYFASSSTFSKGFEQKDDKGDIVKVNDKPIIDTAAIAICLMAGRDLGLDPAGSLLLGTKLNTKTYLAILKGRALGFDPTTSMEKIISIPTKNGLVSYTMVDIISAKLIQGGVSFLPFIKDNEPFYRYFNPLTNDEYPLDDVLDEQDNLKSIYFIFHPAMLKEDIQREKEQNKIPISRQLLGRYCKVIMRRKVNGTIQTLPFRFSTIDAQRANFLPSYDANGKVLPGCEGKNVWIANEPQMMRNRTISIPGRIIGADLLQGLMTEDEALDIIDTEAKDVTKE